MVQACEAMPAHTSLYLLQRFPLTDEDAHRLTVQGVAGLQLADGEGGGEGWLAHPSHIWNGNHIRLTHSPGEAPFWEQFLRQVPERRNRAERLQRQPRLGRCFQERCALMRSAADLDGFRSGVSRRRPGS